MKSLPCVRLLVAALLAACVWTAAPAAPAPKPTAEQIARWVKQLGDNDFAAREEASKKLWAAGEPAEAPLQEALKSDDPEVARRAREILDKFRWGIYPDTPKEVVAYILEYQAAANPNKKLEIIRELMRAGEPARKALRKIASSEEDLELRQRVFQRIVTDLPLLLAERHYDDVEGLLEAGLMVKAIQPGPYAAYWLLRGKLDDRIAHFEATAKKADGKNAAEVLAYLYRAKGDLAAARRAADKAELPALVEDLLFEAGNWKELAGLPDRGNDRDPVEKAAFQATYQRLAGNDKGFADALAELQRLAKANADPDTTGFHIAKALFLNDRPAEAMETLVASRPEMRFEILCSQLHYPEALAMVEKARADGSKSLPTLEVLQARTLYSLGEKEKAREIFARRAASIKEATDPREFEPLVEAEMRVGLKEEALEHCGQLLGLLKPVPAVGQFPERPLLAHVFPEKTDSAAVWWGILRLKYADETTVQSLKRLRDLLEGKTPAKEVKAMVGEAQRVAGALPPGDLKPAALAEVALAAGLHDLARACLEEATSAPGFIRLGDFLADRKEWDRAAERYKQAWEKDHREALPLFLAGWAMTKAGQAAEGAKLMEQSHWLLLGDEAGRYTFQNELTRRGHAEASRREADILRRVARPAQFYALAALRRIAADAVAHKDYPTAARAFEESMLGCLRPYTNFVQPGAYVGVPAMVHRLKAAGHLAADRIEPARQEIALARTGLPGGMDLPIQLIPQLERKGHKKDADQLFSDTLAVYEKLCKDYPKCAWMHNSAAWLSACCRRNLDDGLEHATKANEMAPNNAGYMDTLAEIHFQRGDKAKAVALQKKVIELDPKKPYFRKQLRRLEAGDPKADRPTEDEE